MTIAPAKTDRYTIISSDTHAGGSHEQYREYLDPQYRGAFDDWRGEYKNPWKDLRDTSLRVRNWDDDVRNEQQEADGVVGEVIFPNTVPPFYPGFVLFAPPPTPEQYELRLAGVRAHNRWLVDFCNRYPERRAGVGQIFLNDIDDAIADVHFIKEHNLRGGILLPNIPPDCKHVRPLWDPEYDRLWEVIEDLEVPLNAHGGTGNPDYGRYAATPMLLMNEVPFYSQRPLVYLIISGVFQRFPKLKFVMTELGAAWLPPFIQQLDTLMDGIRRNKAGEMRFDNETVPPRTARDLRHFRRGEAALAPAVELRKCGEGDMIEIEVQPHADRVSGGPACCASRARARPSPPPPRPGSGAGLRPSRRPARPRRRPLRCAWAGAKACTPPHG